MKTILITGACGEMGHGLVKRLQGKKEYQIVALDLKDPDEGFMAKVNKFYQADILDYEILKQVFEEFEFDGIFHLAAILSTGAEKDPYLAQKVNVQGTLNLLELSNKNTTLSGKLLKFMFPSSIAAYGLPDISIKSKTGKVKEDDFQSPITMYGMNKLYCEKLGNYYSRYYKLLENKNNFLDFRAIRFPGIISAETTPTGGTSDYGPEMLHAAAKGEPYSCFVRPDTRIPFMVMDDAVRALIELFETAKNDLSVEVYNISGFSVSAEEIKNIIEKSFSNTKIEYEIDERRQLIVDSWPEDVDDSLAKTDWGWKAEYGFEQAFNEYLVPKIRSEYES